MRVYLTFLLVLNSTILRVQEYSPQVLCFTEYLAYVKQYHPMARQANLHLEMGK